MCEEFPYVALRMLWPVALNCAHTCVFAQHTGQAGMLDLICADAVQVGCEQMPLPSFAMFLLMKLGPLLISTMTFNWSDMFMIIRVLRWAPSTLWATSAYLTELSTSESTISPSLIEYYPICVTNTMSCKHYTNTVSLHFWDIFN